MITKLLVLIAKNIYGKQLLGIINAGNGALAGKRSEIIIGIVAVVAVLGHLGIIPEDACKQIETILLSMLPLTLAEKTGNVLKVADTVLPQPQKPQP